MQNAISVRNQSFKVCVPFYPEQCVWLLFPEHRLTAPNELSLLSPQSPANSVCACTYVRMDGWMDVRMHVWMDGCTYVRMDGWMDVHKYNMLYLPAQ